MQVALLSTLENSSDISHVHAGAILSLLAVYSHLDFTLSYTDEPTKPYHYFPLQVPFEYLARLGICARRLGSGTSIQLTKVGCAPFVQDVEGVRRRSTVDQIFSHLDLRVPGISDVGLDSRVHSRYRSANGRRAIQNNKHHHREINNRACRLRACFPNNNAQDLNGFQVRR